MPWEMTESKYLKLINRVTTLEETMNDVLVAIGNYATTTQVQQLLAITTQQITSLSQDVEGLEQRVVDLEEEPIS